MRILVVEDEPKVARSLQEGLEGEGHQVALAVTGEQGFYLVNAEIFDVVILDLMLPDRSGIEVLRTLRNRGLATPVLILTARDAVEDRVLGLDSGADDYLVKPFAFPELLARVRALGRRGHSEPAGLTMKVADLEIDLRSRRTSRSGQNIELTPREYELLEFLARHRGQVVSREMLARQVWQETLRIASLDNVIDVHVARLRRKVDEPFGRPLIKTVRGVGFVMAE